eukprot:4358045-Pyramimonas_sp.AAC.1
MFLEKFPNALYFDAELSYGCKLYEVPGAAVTSLTVSACGRCSKLKSISGARELVGEENLDGMTI